MSEPDVRTVSKEWVEANIPAGSSLALDGTFFMPRLAFSPQQLEVKKLRAAERLQSKAKMRRIDALLSKPYQPSYELNFLLSRKKDDFEKPGFLFSEPLVPFDWEVLKQNGIQYVLLIDEFRRRAILSREAHPEEVDPKEVLFFKALPANADRIATFSPYRDSGDLTIHDPHTMTGGPFLWEDILPRERGGYPVSIYRIRS
jgi:hypothetical protein